VVAAIAVAGLWVATGIAIAAVSRQSADRVLRNVGDKVPSDVWRYAGTRVEVPAHRLSGAVAFVNGRGEKPEEQPRPEGTRLRLRSG